jgi:hypothetical protein
MAARARRRASLPPVKTRRFFRGLMASSIARHAGVPTEPLQVPIRIAQFRVIHGAKMGPELNGRFGPKRDSLGYASDAGPRRMRQHTAASCSWI